MRAAIVDPNNDPAYGKFTAAGITVPFFDPRDPRVDAGYLDGVKAHAGITACGLFFAWNFWPALSGPQFAEKCDAELRRIGWLGNALVCLDIETHDVGYVVSALTRWRQLRPKRFTWWSLEGFQGGLFGSGAVAAIAGTGIRIAPQCYGGGPDGMAPLGHSVLLDLLIAGFPGELLDATLDAARLPYSWRGFAFSQGRLL